MFELEIYETVNILGLLIGIVFGLIAQKKQFCFSGSIKDYMLTKSTKRGSSVIAAMITAILATTLISAYFEIDLTESVYHNENINYFAIILGGALFGTGMMMADGCSNRHLIKFAQGDINSLIALIFIGIFAFATTKGFLYGYLDPIVNNETLLNLSSSIGSFKMNLFIVLGILILILALLLRKVKRITSLIDGFFIGLLIAFAWYVTGVIGEESMERTINLTAVTFVYPTAKSIELFSYYEINELTFGISIIIGVLIGAFTMSKFNRRYSFGCTSASGENRVKYNMIGGAMMGTGGILSIGCTVGQGLTGLSTLAFASAVAILSIFISAVISAIILNKKNKLPMCFIFDWDDEKKEQTTDYQI